MATSGCFGGQHNAYKIHTARGVNNLRVIIPDSRSLSDINHTRVGKRIAMQQRLSIANRKRTENSTKT